MVVDDFDFRRFLLDPDEADAVPVVYTNAILALAAPGKPFEPVAGRQTQGAQSRRAYELVEPRASLPMQAYGERPSSCP